jgi:WXXGXW repeat (2 copies)
VVTLLIGDDRGAIVHAVPPREATTMRQTSNSLRLLSACALTLGLTLVALPGDAVAQMSVTITLAPPALPVYEQPMLVQEGAIWAPGYWDYDQDNGYFWVPGTWVEPPEVGLLWTPGYWGWGNGGYAWNEGYWGPTVGFYGGIDYGFGYSGRGYGGGHWQGRQFYYNTAVSQVNVTNIHNTYTQTVVNNTTVNRVSFNGGTGGVMVRPSAEEQAAARAPHQAATTVQVQHRQAAMGDHSLLASVNHGKPPIAATPRPAELNGAGVVRASAAGSPREASKAVATSKAPQRVAAATPTEMRPSPVHAAELPPVAHQAVPSTGSAERDRVNQQQQDALHDGQERQRQELQQKQAADHEQAAKQPAAGVNMKALEQQHQAQTQALAQRHATEQKTLRETQQKKPEEKGQGAPHS